MLYIIKAINLNSMRLSIFLTAWKKQFIRKALEIGKYMKYFKVKNIIIFLFSDDLVKNVIEYSEKTNSFILSKSWRKSTHNKRSWAMQLEMKTY